MKMRTRRRMNSTRWYGNSLRTSCCRCSDRIWWRRCCESDARQDRNHRVDPSSHGQAHCGWESPSPRFLGQRRPHLLDCLPEESLVGCSTDGPRASFAVAMDNFSMGVSASCGNTDFLYAYGTSPPREWCCTLRGVMGE